MERFEEDEIEVVEDYLARKAARLEESGLTDSYCYPRIVGFLHKLRRLKKESEDEEALRDQRQ